MYGNEIEFCRSSRAENHLRTCPGRQFAMTGNKVGVEVRLNDVLDGETVAFGLIEVNVDIAAWINDGGFALGSEEIGGVGETGEIELLKMHGSSAAGHFTTP